MIIFVLIDFSVRQTRQELTVTTDIYISGMRKTNNFLTNYYGPCLLILIDT